MVRVRVSFLDLGRDVVLVQLCTEGVEMNVSRGEWCVGWGERVSVGRVPVSTNVEPDR